MPFITLTNGGGFTEEKKAEQLNKYLKYDGYERKLTSKNIVQCHTPLSEGHLVEKYKDKYVLICGYDEVLNTAINYGYTKAIHVDELAAVYPNSVPLDIPT